MTIISRPTQCFWSCWCWHFFACTKWSRKESTTKFGSRKFCRQMGNLQDNRRCALFVHFAIQVKKLFFFLPLDLETKTTNILCTLPKDEGICRDAKGTQTRFYYDPRSGFCQRFSFGGCGGNVNNFQTYDDCVNFCGKFQGRFLGTSFSFSTHSKTLMSFFREGRVALASFDGVGQDGNSINGTLIFTQKTSKSRVIAKGQINGLSNGAHQLFFYTEAFNEGTCVPSKVDIEVW